MLHRKVIETKIGNAAHSLLLFIFTRQIPPSHRSKDNPWRQTHCGHELSPRDIPPSAAQSGLSAPPSARRFGCPSACHPWKARRCSILRCSRCCGPYSGRPPLLLICPRGCCRHDKSRNDNRCRKSHAHGASGRCRLQCSCDLPWSHCNE